MFQGHAAKCPIIVDVFAKSVGIHITHASCLITKKESCFHTDINNISVPRDLVVFERGLQTQWTGDNLKDNFSQYQVLLWRLT